MPIATKPGYYWARQKLGFSIGDYQIVEVREGSIDNPYVVMIDCDEDWRMEDFTDWFGPLEPPKERMREDRSHEWKNICNSDME